MPNNAKVVLIKGGNRFLMVVPHRCPLHVRAHDAARGRVGGVRWEPYASREDWEAYLKRSEADTAVIRR